VEIFGEKMYVVLLRDEQGNVSYIDRVFDDEQTAYIFVKQNHIPDHNFLICTNEEWEAYQQALAQSQQPQGAYQQNVETVIDERQEEPIPRPRPTMVTRYRPVTNYKPAFIGSSMKKKG
jgi:hypothetical protein